MFDIVDAAGVNIPAILRAVARERNVDFVDIVEALGEQSTNPQQHVFSGPISVLSGGWPALAKPEYFLPNATNGGCKVPLSGFALSL